MVRRFQRWSVSGRNQRLLTDDDGCLAVQAVGNVAAVVAVGDD